jgi:hypothetical protein
LRAVQKAPSDFTSHDDQVVFSVLLLGIFAMSIVVLSVVLIVTATHGTPLPAP